MVRKQVGSSDEKREALTWQQRGSLSNPSSEGTGSDIGESPHLVLTVKKDEVLGVPKEIVVVYRIVLSEERGETCV